MRKQKQLTAAIAAIHIIAACLLILSITLVVALSLEQEQSKVTEVITIVKEPEYRQALGEFTITYYCSCEQCCDKWAIGRPQVNGKEIVFTASGSVAEDGVTVAADPKVLPYGTVIYIEGLGYRIVQDCGGLIKGNRLDIYVDSHKDTVIGGKHTALVYKMNEDS